MKIFYKIADTNNHCEILFTKLGEKDNRLLYTNDTKK